MKAGVGAIMPTWTVRYVSVRNQRCFIALCDKYENLWLRPTATQRITKSQQGPLLRNHAVKRCMQKELLLATVHNTSPPSTFAPFKYNVAVDVRASTTA